MTTTTPPNPPDAPLVRVEQKLDSLSLERDKKFDSLEKKVENLSDNVKILTCSVDRSNYKFDTYQQANQQVVRLAFALIAGAAIAVNVSAVFISR